MSIGSKPSALRKKSRRGGGDSRGRIISEEEFVALDLGRCEFFIIPSQSRLRDPNRPPKFVPKLEPPLDREDYPRYAPEVARLARYSVDRSTFFTEMKRHDLALLLTHRGYLRVVWATKRAKQTNADRTYEYRWS